MSPHFSALLAFLIIGIGLCHSATLEKLRIARDTRNIPSNMFKPLNSNSNENQNTTGISPNSENTFAETSLGEAHVVTDRVLPNRRKWFSEPNPQEEDYDDGQPQSFGFQREFPSVGRTTHFQSSFRNSNTGSSSGFGNPGFSDSQFGSIRPFGSQTIPLMSNGIGPSFTPSGFPDSNFGRDPSNNFYRSESYSYSSDGNGPPQIERNVFDSRLGHGLSNRNF